LGEPVVPYPQRAEPGTPVQAEPVPVAAPAAVTTATRTEDANARSLRLARKEAQRVRKQRMARDRARAVQQAASQQQNQLYYGYAPQPTYGPFAGWGPPQRW
jgi:hypothetical protein